MRLRVRSLALLSGLRIQHCHELWWCLQTRLGSRVVVALFNWSCTLCRPEGTAPIKPLAWEPPYVAGAALEKAKRQRKKTKPTKNKNKNKKPEKVIIKIKRVNEWKVLEQFFIYTNTQ